jgi:hypothetical protein
MHKRKLELHLLPDREEYSGFVFCLFWTQAAHTSKDLDEIDRVPVASNNSDIYTGTINSKGQSDEAAIKAQPDFSRIQNSD